LQEDAVQLKRSELLGSNEQLRAAVGRASADLKQQQAAAALADASKEQLQERILVGGTVRLTVLQALLSRNCLIQLIWLQSLTLHPLKCTV
jgi:hypothetical protein